MIVAALVYTGIGLCFIGAVGLVVYLTTSCLHR